MAVVHKELNHYHKRILKSMTFEILLGVAIVVFTISNSYEMYYLDIAFGIRVVFILSMLGLLAVILGLPVYIYFQYMDFTRGVQVTIDRVNSIVIVQGPVRSKEFKFSQIQNIIRVFSNSWGRGYWQKRFFHYVFEMKSGDKFVITSLMTDDISVESVPSCTELVPWAIIKVPPSLVLNFQLRKNENNA